MASLPSDRVYFPPLEDCLKGERILLSWKLVASALSDTKDDRLTSGPLTDFIKDGYVQLLLRSPSKAFDAPSPQSKSEFETKTAAINVTPTPNGKYDIKEIKEDALWLSKNAGIGEVAALRIVAIEFQTRAHNHLNGPLSSQDAVNLQEAVGANGAQATAFLAAVNTSGVMDAETIWADFNKEEGKRQRLLATYLSERRYFMMSADHALGFMVQAPASGAAPAALDALRKDVLATAFGVGAASAIKADVLDTLVSTYLGLVPGCLDRPESGIQAVVKDVQILDDDLAIDWVRTALTEAVHALSLVFQVLDLSETFVSPDIITQWFEFADKYGFLDQLQAAHETIAELVEPLKGLVSVISVKVLNITRSLAYLDKEIDLGVDEDAYLSSPEVLKTVHDAVTGAAGAGLVTASPVAFSWSLIIHRLHVSYQERAERRDLAQNRQAQEGFEREIQAGAGPLARRSSAGSIVSLVSLESQPYDSFLTETVVDLQVVEQLAMSVTAGGRVYNHLAEVASFMGQAPGASFRSALGSRMRLVFLDLLKVSFPIVGYQSEPVSALLSVLAGGQQYWDLSGRSLPTVRDVASSALNDPDLLDFYVFNSLNRYPYEFLPFISLCKILASSLSTHERSGLVLESLLKTPSLTFILPDGFQDYELAQEEDNTNTIRIAEDIPLFTNSSAWKRRIADEEPFCIPAGTSGRFVSDTGRVVLVEYEHSTLALLGKRLDANLSPDAYILQLGYLSPEEVSEAIVLIATLIRAETLKASGGADTSAEEAGLAVLREASRALPRTKDFISVVCDTLDTYIQQDMTALDGSEMAVLTACIAFLHSILPLCPGRVWSYMARCALLNTESRAGRLSRITGSLDMGSERFDFLTSAAKFFSSLVDSAMASAVQRKAGGKLGGRQKANESLWLGTSDKILAQVSLSVAQTAVDVLENSSTWRFSSELDRSILIRDIVPILSKLILHAFSMGEVKDGSNTNPLVACLEPAAKYIINSFLASSSGSLRFQPLLSTLLVAFDMPDSTLYPLRTGIISQRLVGVLGFSASLIRAATYLELPATTIETQLLKGGSLIARLCAGDDAYKGPAFALLGALAESAVKGVNEPPSLLGYLGPHISRSFIQVLSRLDRPFNRSTDSIRHWQFFSTIIRNRQQWMANCLLTGKTPREALRGDAKTAKLAPDSVLAAALAKLRSIKTIPSPEALAVLDFFTSAQNYWPWTIFATQQDTAFLPELRGYVRDLKSATITAKANPEAACNEARVAAYIAETFAMQLYHLRQTGREDEFAREVVDDLDYFLRDGVAVSGYNHSLHANFARNFAKRYPGCGLDNFKRATLSSRQLGKQYYYALDIAEEMLRFDPGWSGPRENGFRSEMQTANLNLSLVDAQIALYHSWEFLLLELSSCLLPKDQKITRQMMQVAEQCLLSNQAAQGPEQIFQRIVMSRANLAMVLVQRLTDISLLPRDILQLLTAIWATINGIDNPFASEQLQYFRTMLKTLYVVLRGYSNSEAPGADPRAAKGDIGITQGVLNILDKVVAQGFRTLVTFIHDPEVTVFPEDIALLTAILQACLCMPGVDQSQVQVMNIMASYDVVHVATSLFSWSDKLAEKGDPVYGELSLLFLLELSTLPAIAEQLACDGLLGHLTSANMATHLQRPNVSPFADGPGAQRCYGIWARGMLPLLLNILTALGATIAPEVAFVLNRFPHLLRSSVERFEAPGLSRTASRDTPHHLTLLSVSEVHSLALLTRVLAALREKNNRDIPEVAWDAPSLLESVEFWLSGRKVLRERLLPLGPREADWRGMRPAGGGFDGKCENRLEEKVVSQLEAVREVLSDAAE